MVQILPPRERPPSFLESLIGSATNKIGEYSQNQAQQKALENEYALKGQLERQKQEAKFANQLQLQEQAQDFLSRLRGKPSEKSSSQLNEEMPSEVSESPFSEEDVLEGTMLNPNIGRALGHLRDVGLREKRENIKAETKEKTRIRQEELGFHKESQKYDEDLTEKTRRAKNQIETFKDIEKAIDSGNVKPGSWTNILRNFGDTGRSLSNAIMNKDEATILSSIPQLLEGWKQVFGVRLTDADLKVLQDKLPDIGKSPEANRSILKVMKKYGDMSLLRSKIASEIKKSNKGIRPLGYSDMIEDRFDEMVRPVKVINPKTGNTIEIPAYKLSDAMNAGAKLADE